MSLWDLYASVQSRRAGLMGDLQAQQQARMQQQQLGQEAALLKPSLEQYGPDFAKAVGSGMLSSSPEARAYAAEKWQAADVQRGVAPNSLLARLQAQTLANTAQGQGITTGANAEARAAELFPMQKNLLGAQIEASRASTAANQRQTFLANQKAQAELAFANMPPAEYFKQVDESRGLSEAVGSLEKLTSLVGNYSHLGRLASPEIRGRSVGMIMSIIPAIQKALNAGAQNSLGTEEREFAMDLIGNPQKLLSMDATTSARLDEILGRLKREYEYKKETRGPFLPSSAFEIPNYDLPSGLVPLGTPPAGLGSGMGPGQPGSYAGIPGHQ